jgi:hypothetical protein
LTLIIVLEKMDEIVLKLASDKEFEMIRVETYVGNCVGNEKGSQFLTSETLVPLAPQTGLEPVTL